MMERVGQLRWQKVWGQNLFIYIQTLFFFNPLASRIKRIDTHKQEHAGQTSLVPLAVPGLVRRSCSGAWGLSGRPSQTRAEKLHRLLPPWGKNIPCETGFAEVYSLSCDSSQEKAVMRWGFLMAEVGREQAAPLCYGVSRNQLVYSCNKLIGVWSGSGDLIAMWLLLRACRFFFFLGGVGQIIYLAISPGSALSWELSSQSDLGSQKSCFSNNSVIDQGVPGKNVSVSNKTLGLNSLPDNPFMLPHIRPVLCLSGNKRNGFGFWTNCFSNSSLEWMKFKNWGSTVFHAFLFLLSELSAFSDLAHTWKSHFLPQSQLRMKEIPQISIRSVSERERCGR